MNKFITSVKQHQQDEKALLATNFYNAETLKAILWAAKQERSEIILQTSPPTLKYLGVDMAIAMARSAAKEYNVIGWLHLDHATDPELILRCINAGYDSVMIDASECNFNENVRLTKEIVNVAHRKNVVVEAELGYIPKLGQSSAYESGLTTPEQAETFVAHTGVDMLAVAIGTAHGFYNEKPKLDFDRLKAIRSVIDIPLVLHGGSGLSHDEWQMAIRNGIGKINFATEIKDTFMSTVRKSLKESKEIDLRKVFLPAIEATSELVALKLKVCSMNGL